MPHLSKQPTALATRHLLKTADGHLAMGCRCPTATCGGLDKHPSFGYAVIFRDVGEGDGSCQRNTADGGIYGTQEIVWASYGTPNGFTGIGGPAGGPGTTNCYFAGVVGKSHCEFGTYGLRNPTEPDSACSRLLAVLADEPPYSPLPPLQVFLYIMPDRGIEVLLIEGQATTFYGTRPFSASDYYKRRTFTNEIEPGIIMNRYADWGNPPEEGPFVAGAGGGGGTAEIIPCADVGTQVSDVTGCFAQYESYWDCVSGGWSAPALVADSSICRRGLGTDWYYDRTESTGPTDRRVYYRRWVNTGFNCDCAVGGCDGVGGVPPDAPDLGPPDECGTCNDACPDVRVRTKLSDGSADADVAVVRSAAHHWQYGSEAGGLEVTLDCAGGLYTLVETVRAGTTVLGRAEWRGLAAAGGGFDPDVTHWTKASDTFADPRTLDAIACTACPTDYTGFCNRYTATFRRPDGTTFARDYVLNFAGGDPSAGEWLYARGGTAGTNNLQCGLYEGGVYSIEASEDDPAPGDGSTYVWNGPPGPTGTPDGPWTPYTKDGAAWDGTGGLTLLSVVCNPIVCTDQTFVAHLDSGYGDRTVDMSEVASGEWQSSTWGSSSLAQAEATLSGGVWTFHLVEPVVGCDWYWTADDDGTGCLKNSYAWTFDDVASSGCSGGTLGGS